MNYSLVLSPNAETDLAEGKLWYENKQLGLGEKFCNRSTCIFRKFRIILNIFLSGGEILAKLTLKISLSHYLPNYR